MQVNIIGWVADSAGALEGGTIEFAQAQRIDNGELLVTQSAAVAQVVRGELKTLSGEPFSLPANPEGTAVRVLERFGGRTFEWWTAVPDIGSVEYRELPIMECSSVPASVWGPPPWVAEVSAMRDEVVVAVDGGKEAVDALGGLAGLEALVSDAREYSVAAGGSAANAGISAAAAADSAASIDVQMINAHFNAIDTDLATKASKHELSSGLLSRSVTPEDFGAVGDGITSDSAAFQLAIDAMPGGGVLTLSRGTEYSLPVTVVLHSNITINGNGATLRKRAGADERCIFSNLSEPNATGYGAGGKNITIKDARFVGDYSIPAAQYKDICVSFNHVDNLRIVGCDFEQGMHNSHYLDLLGCSNVSISGCSFSGMRPVAGREYIEAIQIDSSTRGGASFDREEVTSYDGLPCKNVRVTECIFQGLQIGATYYQMPTALGQHGGALVGDEGYIENIVFSDNQCIGWHTPPTGNWVGWVTLPGARGVVISGNVFAWTGPKLDGSAAVINMAGLGSVVPLSDVQKTSATSVNITPHRGPIDWVIDGNVFKGFQDGPASNTSGLIYSDARTANRIVVSNNTCDGARSPALYVNHREAQFAHEIVISGNSFTTAPDRSVQCVYVAFTRPVITGNMFVCSETTIGVYLNSCTMVNVSGNTFRNGTYLMRLANIDNGILQGNIFQGYANAGLLVGDDADSSPTYDLTIAVNRMSSSPVGSKSSMIIKPKATRTFRFGNRTRDGGPISDNGTSSKSDSALDFT